MMHPPSHMLHPISLGSAHARSKRTGNTSLMTRETVLTRYDYFKRQADSPSGGGGGGSGGRGRDSLGGVSGGGARGRDSLGRGESLPRNQSGGGGSSGGGGCNGGVLRGDSLKMDRLNSKTTTTTQGGLASEEPLIEIHDDGVQTHQL